VRVLVVQRGDDPGEVVDGIRHRAAEDTGVQVALGRADRDVEPDEPPHAHAHRRDVTGPHRGVRDHDDVAAEALPLACEQSLEVGAADLLLALDQELDVGGQPSVLDEQAAHRLDLEEDLALVVDRPSTA
jgi:hypothetical protein